MSILSPALCAKQEPLVLYDGWLPCPTELEYTHPEKEYRKVYARFTVVSHA